MIRLFVTFVTVAAVLAIGAPAFADDNGFIDSGDASAEVPTEVDEATAAPQRRLFDADHRREIYEESRLQRRRAVLYSLALPGLGNFYAEQYALGTLFMSTLVFSGMFLGFGLVNNHPDLITLGLVTTGLTYAGAGVTSYLGVQRYNAQLRRNLHLNSYLSRGDTTEWVIHWSWRF